MIIIVAVVRYPVPGMLCLLQSSPPPQELFQDKTKGLATPRAHRCHKGYKTSEADQGPNLSSQSWLGMGGRMERRGGRWGAEVPLEDRSLLVREFTVSQ